MPYTHSYCLPITLSVCHPSKSISFICRNLYYANTSSPLVIGRDNILIDSGIDHPKVAYDEQQICLVVVELCIVLVSVSEMSNYLQISAFLSNTFFINQNNYQGSNQGRIFWLHIHTRRIHSLYDAAYEICLSSSSSPSELQLAIHLSVNSISLSTYFWSERMLSSWFKHLFRMKNRNLRCIQSD